MFVGLPGKDQMWCLADGTRVVSVGENGAVDQGWSMLGWRVSIASLSVGAVLVLENGPYVMDAEDVEAVKWTTAACLTDIDVP
jgi:hypothetical protein